MINVAAFVLSVLLLFPVSSYAQALAAGDFDGDGYSDISVIEIGDAQSLSWSGYSQLGANLGNGVTLGTAGNHIALANWASPTIAQRGLVSVNGNKLLWTVAPPVGATVSKSFGAKSGLVIAGADFDNSGYADATFVRSPRSSGAPYSWRIRTDFFRNLAGGPSHSRLLKVRFGVEGDVLFFMNVRGRNDWLGALRTNPQGAGSQIELRDPVKGRTRKFSVASFSYDSIRPLPIRQVKGADLLALAARENGNTRIQFVNIRGELVRDALLPGEGELIVGEYLPAAGQEIGIQVSGGLFVYNPVTAEESSVSIPDGILVDDININVFESSEEPSCEDEVLDPYDGTDLFLWKPKGEHSRKLKVLLPQVYTGKVTEMVLIHPTTGQIIEYGQFSYDPTNPNARTIASYTKAGGQYPPNVTVRARLAAGCYKSWVIPKPNRRTD